MKLSKNLKDGESILISPLRRGKKVERIAFGKERDFVPSVYNTSDAVFNRDYCDAVSYTHLDVYKRQGIFGAIKAIWVSVGCRILIGVAAGWLWKLLEKVKVNQVIALPIVGLSLIHIWIYWV